MTMQPMAAERDVDRTVAAEDALATKLVLALLRIAQQARLYDAENDAQRRVFEETAKLAADYGRATGRNATLFLSERAVYVGRRLLRASRSVYAGAAQLRELLLPLGASQITIGHDVPVSDLKVLQEAFRAAQTDPSAARAPRDMSRIRLRLGRAPGELAELERLSPVERAVKVYTLAIVVLRRFYAGLQAGQGEIPGHMRHIAVHLAELARTATPAFLAATAARPAHDDAGRAVACALLAASAARSLDADARTLERLVMAALLCDVGKPRLAGLQPTGEVRRGVQLPAIASHLMGELPRCTAVVTTALGKLTDAGMARSVLVYEALHLTHSEETGPPYRGVREASAAARLIARSRRFHDALARGRSGGDAMAEVLESAWDQEDRAAAQLLMSALGIFPTGTVVELSNGRRARVVTSPERAGATARPVVALLGDDAELLDLARVADVEVARVVSLGEETPAAVRGRRAPADGATARPPRRQASTDVDIPGAPRAPHIEAAVRDDDLYILVGPKDSSKPPLLTSVPPPPSSVPRFEAAVPFSVPPAPAPQAEQQSLRPQLKATAQGTLAKTPLPRILLFMLDHALSGTLLLHSPERGQCAIYFHEGEPCNARTPEIVSPLGPLLVRMGHIDDAALGHSLRAVANSKQLLGHHLVARRLVSPETLRAALKQQLINKLAHMMGYEATTRYAFYDDTNLLSDYGGAELVPCEPLSLFMMGVRSYTGEAEIDEALAPLGAAPLALHARAEPERLGLTESERAVVARLRRGPASVAELGDRRTVYALVTTRSIDLSEGTRDPVGIRTPVSSL